VAEIILSPLCFEFLGEYNFDLVVLLTVHHELTIY